LPFKIKLNDFIAEKYRNRKVIPRLSKVTVQDKEPFDARIYMNNVLDHDGYRFFQSGFDPDEKELYCPLTMILGTALTYAGYFMLYFAMMAILFTKYSRFADIKRKLEVVKTKKKLLTILVLLFSLSGFAQEQEHNHDEHDGHAHEAAQPPVKHENHTKKVLSQEELNTLITKYKVPEEHAAKIRSTSDSRWWGRMKPINTFSSELLRKVSHDDSYNNMNSDQVFCL
jgi:hypothetical protein